MKMIKLKRIYEKYSENDGYRILVDRLWPRGISKEKARIDLWPKEVAPSDKLRKLYLQNPEKLIEFQQKYQKELEDNLESLERITKIVRKEKIVTLIYSAKTENPAHAILLQHILTKNKI